MSDGMEGIGNMVGMGLMAGVGIATIGAVSHMSDNMTDRPRKKKVNARQEDELFDLLF
jgi:hypothetical protein